MASQQVEQIREAKPNDVDLKQQEKNLLNTSFTIAHWLVMIFRVSKSNKFLRE